MTRRGCVFQIKGRILILSPQVHGAIALFPVWEVTSNTGDQQGLIAKTMGQWELPNEAHDFAESPFDNEEEETEEEEGTLLEDKSAPSLCGVLPPPPPLKKLPSYLGESLHPTTNTICTQDVVWTWRRNSYINCNFKWADSRRSNSVSPCLCCGVITLFIIHCSHNFRFNICMQAMYLLARVFPFFNQPDSAAFASFPPGSRLLYCPSSICAEIRNANAITL